MSSQTTYRQSPIERELHQLRAKLEVIAGRDQLVRDMLQRAGEHPDTDGILGALRKLIERANAPHGLGPLATAVWGEP